MHWVLIVFMSSSIHSVNFEDYQSCINAGNKIQQSSSSVKFICAEK